MGDGGSGFSRSFPAPGVWLKPERLKGGRPSKNSGDRYTSLRARALELCISPSLAASSPVAFKPWCEDDKKPCDRNGLILGFVCNRKKCGKRFFRRLACKKSDCPRCALEVGRQRVERMRARMAGASQLGVLVFTFPMEWRAYLTPIVCLEIEIAFRQKLLNWAVKTFGGEIGGRSFWHPCGDKCTKCGAGKGGSGHNSNMGKLGKCTTCFAVAPYKPHLNILIPSVAMLPNGTIRRLKMHLGASQLKELHKIARMQLAEIANVIGENVEPWNVEQRFTHVDGSERIPRKANIFWSYKEGPSKIAHAMRYFGRVFPAWRNAMPHLGRDFGLLAGQDKKTETKRTQYRAVLAVHIPKTVRVMDCPCCDGPLSSIGVLARQRAEVWKWGAFDLDNAITIEATSKTRN